MARLAAKPLLIVVALRFALNMSVAGRYGWHRDELYYAAAARHLQAGYIDFPPVTPLLAALAHVLFGDSLVGLRGFALVAGACTILLAGLIARELGGDARAQTIAFVAVGFSPLLVATNGLFQPVSFDQLTTMLVLWLSARIMLGRGSWLALGLAVGAGLETKYTIAVVVLMLACGTLAFRRDLLTVRHVLSASAVALAVWAPNLVWQAGHHWISLTWFAHPAASATDESRPLFIGNVLLLTHIVAVPVAVAGTRLLWRTGALRPLAFVIPATVLFYFAAGGKSYYALPVVMFAVACGAVPFSRWATRRRLVYAGTAFVAVLVALLPVGLPVLPLRTAVAWHIVDARADYKDEVGWPSFAAQVARVTPAPDVIVARNYGEAGALDLFGHGLPPVASPHLTFRYWRPPVTGRNALLVGFPPAEVSSLCTHVRRAGAIAMPLDNDEQGRPLLRCTLRGSLARLWPAFVRRFGK